MQREVAAALDAAGLSFREQVQLTPQDRPDFMVGSSAVELKIDGALVALIRQLHRYAQHQDVASIVVVSSKLRLADLPPTINNKPVAAVWVARGF